jgi:hypothetical protein
MAKPAGAIQIAFGLPSRFAHESGPDQDMDQGDMPDQEEEPDDGEQGDDERGPDVLTTLYHALSNGEDKAAHIAMGIAQCLQKMVHSASRDDSEGLTRWYNQCHELGDSLDTEEGD